MASKLTRRARMTAPLPRDGIPQQLCLRLSAPSSSSSPPPARASRVERLPSLDQRMSTAEVLRVVGVNRSTLFRWTQKGRFPHKHPSGGWLRSEVERWLADKGPHSPRVEPGTPVAAVNAQNARGASGSHTRCQ